MLRGRPRNEDGCWWFYNIYFYLLYCFIKLSDDSQYEHQYLPTFLLLLLIKFMNSFIPRT